MYVLKSNIGRCQPLKQIVNVLGRSPWNPLSSSSVSADNVDNEEAAFGLLSSDPSSQFYETGRKKTPEDNVPKRPDKGKFKEQRSPNSTVPKLHKALDQDLAVGLWQKLKIADDEETLRLSRNLIQDDDENEYLRYISRDHKLRRETPSKIYDGNSRKGKNSLQSIVVQPTFDAEVEDDEFGKLSPPKDLYELEEGDEGDEKQRKYEEAMLERRHKPVYYGNMIKALCKERRLLDALKILEEEMPAVNAKPNDYCYNVLINACGRAGYTKKAFQLYNQMKKRGLKVHGVTYTGLFNACAHSPWPTTDGLQRAHKLRKQLIEKNYAFNETISHVMVKAFGRCGDTKTAFQIVDEMLGQGLMVSTSTINFMLQACISDQETGFRYALLVWRKMRELRLDPDLYSYNLLVRCTAICRAGDPALTSQLLEDNSKPKKIKKVKETSLKSNSDLEDSSVTDLKKDNIQLPTDELEKASVTTLEDTGVQLPGDELEKTSESTFEDTRLQLEVLEPNSKSGRLQKRLSAGEAELQGLPNLLGRRITAGSAIALASLDQPEDRLALLGGTVGLMKQMTRDRVTPNLKTVTQLIDSLPSNNESEESLLQFMKDVGLTPDTQFCNMLIRKRCFRYDLTAAKDVLDVMQEHHLLPDLVTFGCLATGCRNFFNAKELLNNMDAYGFRPNLEIMTILLKNCLMKWNYFGALEILRVMHDRNITPDTELLSFLEDSKSRARKAILNMEASKVERTYKERRQMEGMNIFLYEYKNWLKKSDVRLPDHPWAQYNLSKADT